MSTIFYLIGWPGSGKRTVGLALAALTGAQLLDNHLINDPVFRAVGANGVGSLPDGVWPLVHRIADAVLEAVEHVAPLDLSYIFTNVLVDRPGESAVYEERQRLAQVRGAQFVPVWLSCNLAELHRRIPLDERRERAKMRDPEALTQMMTRHGSLLPRPPEALLVHTDQHTPQDSAHLILTYAERLAGT